MLYATRVADLEPKELSIEAAEALKENADAWLVYEHRCILAAGAHSPAYKSISEVAKRYPNALVALLLALASLLPSTADAGGLVAVRDQRTGKQTVVWAQPIGPAVVSEPARRSPAFDRIWAGYAGPVGRLGSQSRPAAPSTWTPPAPATQGWLVNPYF